MDDHGVSVQLVLADRIAQLRNLADRVLVNVHHDITCDCPSCDDVHKLKYLAENAEELANAVNEHLDLLKARPCTTDERIAELREKYGEKGAIWLYNPHGITGDIIQSKFQKLAADVRELLDMLKAKPSNGLIHDYLTSNETCVRLRKEVAKLKAALEAKSPQPKLHSYHCCCQQCLNKVDEERLPRLSEAGLDYLKRKGQCLTPQETVLMLWNLVGEIERLKRE